MDKSRGQTAAALTTLGRYQVIVAIAIVIIDFLLVPFVANLPLGLMLFAGITLGLGGVGTLVLLRYNQIRMATYVLVLSGVGAVEIIQLIIGTGTGGPAAFVWPVISAVLLWSNAAGFITLMICVALGVGNIIAQQVGVYHTLITADAATLAGRFVAIFSILLVVSVAAVARDSERRTLAESEERARQLATALDQVRASTSIGATVTSTARGLAANLVNSSLEQQSLAATAARSITQISTQIAELSTTATRIAVSARQIHTLGEATQETAGAAQSRLQDDREQLSQAVKAGEQLRETARLVSSKVKQMSQILNLITEVAEETHMLSLNATIEAAGTGEAGKRFRVIASEVGNLASKVSSSTDQIATIVQDVQANAMRMLASANQTVESIKSSQASNLATGEQIQQVTAAVTEVAREGFLIVSSTEQQRRATSEIESASGAVTNVSQQAEEISKQLASIASQLNLTVDRLAAILPAPESASTTTAATGGDNSGAATDNTLRVTNTLSQPGTL